MYVSKQCLYACQPVWTQQCLYACQPVWAQQSGACQLPPSLQWTSALPKTPHIHMQPYLGQHLPIAYISGYLQHHHILICDHVLTSQPLYTHTQKPFKSSLHWYMPRTFYSWLDDQHSNYSIGALPGKVPRVKPELQCWGPGMP